MSPRRDPCPHCKTLRLHREYCPLSRERRWLASTVGKLLDKLNEPDLVPEAYRYDPDRASTYRSCYAIEMFCTLMTPELAQQLRSALHPTRNPPRAMCSGLRGRGLRGDQCLNRRQIGYRDPMCAWCCLNFDVLIGYDDDGHPVHGRLPRPRAPSPRERSAAAAESPASSATRSRAARGA